MLHPSEHIPAPSASDQDVDVEHARETLRHFKRAGVGFAVFAISWTVATRYADMFAVGPLTDEIVAVGFFGSALYGLFLLVVTAVHELRTLLQGRRGN